MEEVHTGCIDSLSYQIIILIVVILFLYILHDSFPRRERVLVSIKTLVQSRTVPSREEVSLKW